MTKRRDISDRLCRMKEISEELRKKRARCSKHCVMWNCEDRDCEIYGEQHLTPSTCPYFINKEVENEKRKYD